MYLCTLVDIFQIETCICDPAGGEDIATAQKYGLAILLLTKSVAEVKSTYFKKLYEKS